MNIVVDALILLVRLCWTYIEALVSIFTPVRPKNISGKIVFITGAGRGFGREIAQRLGRLQCRLALVDIDETSVAETANLVREYGVEVYSYRCDVTKVKDIKAVANRIRNDMGEVDILINNAGIMHGKPLLKLDENEIRRTLEINTLAHFWTVQEFLPSMLARNTGHIVCVSSVAGVVGTQLLIDYCASKFAVTGFCEALERELTYLKAKDIKVTTIYPMAANTKLVTGINEHCAYTPGLSPLLSVEEVGEAIVNGILRQERHVYVPTTMKHLSPAKWLLPAKGIRLLEEFIGSKFVEAKN